MPGAAHRMMHNPSGPSLPVAGAVAWWDASQITGVADGAALGSWSDLTGNGHNLSQATGTKQPTYYKTTAGKLVNGLPAVWFDGTDDWMSVAVSLPQPFTVCFVATPGGVNEMFFSDATVTTFCEEQSAALVIGASTSTNVGADSTLLESRIVGFSGASSFGKIGSAAPTTGNPGTGGITNFVMGAFNETADFMNGPICEMAVFPRLLSTTDQTTMYSYFKNKWGTP